MGHKSSKLTKSSKSTKQIQSIESIQSVEPSEPNEPNESKFDFSKQSLSKQTIDDYKLHLNKIKAKHANDEHLVYYLIEDYLGRPYPQFDKLTKFQKDMQDFMLIHLWNICHTDLDLMNTCLLFVEAFGNLFMRMRNEFRETNELNKSNQSKSFKGIPSDHSVMRTTKSIEKVILFCCLELVDDHYVFSDKVLEDYFLFVASNSYVRYELESDYSDICSKVKKFS